MDEVNFKAQKRFSHYYGLLPTQMDYKLRYDITKQCCISEAKELINNNVKIQFWQDIIKAYESDSF